MRERLFDAAIFEERFRTIQRVFAWEHVPSRTDSIRAHQRPALRPSIDLC